MRLKHWHIIILLSLVSYKTFGQGLKETNVISPNGNLKLKFWLTKSGEAKYAVDHKNQAVVKTSALGLLTDQQDFGRSLTFTKLSSPKRVSDNYELYTGKRSKVVYQANKATIHLQNKAGARLDIIFQVSDDGVAFQYFFPGKIELPITITDELTSFHFDTSTRAFLQPMQVSKTGWEKTNPAYEEHYRQNISVTDTAPTKAGWVYPALFQSANAWVLISEALIDGNYCATHLRPSSPDGEYTIGLADEREVLPGKGHLPTSRRPFSSAWRVITIGSLKAIVESTLGTDVSKPAASFDKSFIKPGKASWSWIMSKDDSIVYSEQVRYIDFASKMNWQYCLVDAAWDKKIGYERIQELSRYAASKNVGLLLWYNSAGDWNTVKYTPKNRLLTKASRAEEFSRLQQMGVKGIKVDFFAGDGQSVMQYYIDILEDAAKYELLVNFHGATLPRGWHRTYPHLLTTEAVRGFEMITFNQADADLAATHCAMLPFTRNVFDPMDFTPMNLYKIDTRVKRKTTSAFELATSVLFTSGIQHFAESPQGMGQVPEFVQTFLKMLPVRWDDTRFIDGFPGKYSIIARRAGAKWYVAGVNAETFEREIELDVKQFNKKRFSLIKDGSEQLAFEKETNLIDQNSLTIKIKPSGGFVVVLE